MGADQIVLITLPMMHAAGSIFFSTCLLAGAVAVLMLRFEPEATLDAIGSDADLRKSAILSAIEILLFYLHRRRP